MDSRPEQLRRMQKEKSTKWDMLSFAVIFSALILRMSYFGFEYHRQLDDYIQYHNFVNTGDHMRLIMTEGLFAARPLAAVFDLYIWGQMPLYISAVILSCMYAAAGVIFMRLFRKHFSTGFFFVVFFSLLPLGFEGTYWISASARILPPLFFGAMAQAVLDRFCESKKWWRIPLFLVLCLLSFGFYEQILVLSLTLSLMMILVHLHQKKRHALWGLTVFVPAAIYFAFTGYFSSGDSMYSGRMNLITPLDGAYFTAFAPRLIRQLGASFAFGGALTLVKGFFRGVVLIFREKIFAAALIPVAAAAVFAAAGRYETEPGGKAPPRWTPTVGLLVAIAPVTPFFILADASLSLRAAAASFLGAGLLFDCVLRRLLKNKMAAVTAVFAAVCLVASVSELYDYRQTTQNDEQAVKALLQADQDYELTGNVGILAMNPSELADQNFHYHEHINGVTSSNWALYGAAVHFNGGELDFRPYPLATDGDCFWDSSTRQSKDPARFDHILYYDAQAGTMEKLTNISAGEAYILYFESGEPCATIRCRGEHGYIELYTHPE